jgi:hypothetical protein
MQTQMAFRRPKNLDFYAATTSKNSYRGLPNAAQNLLLQYSTKSNRVTGFRCVEIDQACALLFAVDLDDVAVRYREFQEQYT